MSGDVSLRRPRTLAWQDRLLSTNLEYLSLGKFGVLDAIEKLRNVPAVELVQRVPLIQHWSPTLDDGFLSGLRGEDFRIENTWCKNIMIGEMAHDVSCPNHAHPIIKKLNETSQGTILRSRYLNDPEAREKTTSACNDILGTSISGQIRKAYDLDANDSYPGMLKFISELRFYLPVVAATKGHRFPESVQVQEYHMDQVSRSACQSGNLLIYPTDQPF